MKLETFEQQTVFWEKETALFGKHLADEGKLKEETIAKHVSRVNDFAEIYLVRYGIGYDELASETVGDFVGRFAISHILNSTKTDIANYITAFKKWLPYLRQVGKISNEQYTAMMDVLKEKDYFLARFDQYMQADTEEEMMDWHNANLVDLNEEEGSTPQAMPLVVDEKLKQLWIDGQKAVPSVVADFRAFLAAVGTGKNVKLTSARKHLPRKFWHELDAQLGWQLIRKPTLNQNQEPLFQFFYAAADVLGLIDVTGANGVVTPKVETYLSLTEQEQAVVLLDTLWNHVPWEKLTEDSGEFWHDLSTPTACAAIARVLASWPVGQALDVDPAWKQAKANNEFDEATLVTSVFLFSVVTLLKRFGFVRAEFPLESDIKYEFDRTPLSMAIEPAGHAVFRYWSKEEPAAPRTPVVSGSKVGRNDPCPCGSGKKYKKCCL
ncbi:SEC-C metal-binding domain-containing protein [Paenibacillus oryzisoli]